MDLNKKIMTGICGALTVVVISGCGSSSAEPGPAKDDTINMSDASFMNAAQAAADQSDESAAPGETAAPGNQPRRFRHQLRARRFFRGLHGEATVRNKDKGFAEVAWQRGQVTAVSGNNLTVRSADGVTWQWIANQNTKVRKKGAKASLSQLAANDWVFVIGTVNGSTRTLRAAVVPKRVPKNAPAPSPSAS
jgi:hypothetical protein